MIPEDISLIDTGAAVARQLQRLLAERERCSPTGLPAHGAVLDQRRSGTFQQISCRYLWNTSGCCAKLQQGRANPGEKPENGVNFRLTVDFYSCEFRQSNKKNQTKSFGKGCF
jgi:hypothetical protein